MKSGQHCLLPRAPPAGANASLAARSPRGRIAGHAARARAPGGRPLQRLALRIDLGRHPTGRDKMRRHDAQVLRWSNGWKLIHSPKRSDSEIFLDRLARVQLAILGRLHPQVVRTRALAAAGDAGSRWRRSAGCRFWRGHRAIQHRLQRLVSGLALFKLRSSQVTRKRSGRSARRSIRKAVPAGPACPPPPAASLCACHRSTAALTNELLPVPRAPVSSMGWLEAGQENQHVALEARLLRRRSLAAAPQARARAWRMAPSPSAPGCAGSGRPAPTHPSRQVRASGPGRGPARPPAASIRGIQASGSWSCPISWSGRRRIAPQGPARTLAQKGCPQAASG